MTLIGVGVLLDFQPITMLVPVMAGMLLLVVAASFAIPGRHLDPPDAIRKDWRNSFKQPGLIAFLASCFCMMMAHGALFSFLTLYLVTSGYSKSTVGLLWTLSFLAEIAGFAGLPWLFRRYSYRTVILISFAAAVVRFIAIGWGASSLTVLAMAQLLHALTFATYHGASVALVQRLFPGDLGMRGQALYSGVTFGTRRRLRNAFGGLDVAGGGAAGSVYLERVVLRSRRCNRHGVAARGHAIGSGQIEPCCSFQDQAWTNSMTGSTDNPASPRTRKCAS